ncbi:MAG: S-ribosylhomocysteine lyase [Oscillospiraceae bacterium]|nr:S-ribosylhomocysteine lyase [Oscillospiraceae bacterium]
MKRISSFDVDHTILTEGIYVSRIDGDVVTYDLRVCRPNTGVIMDNVTMHTEEHMFATYIRNSEISDDVLYFGPMGCQTGFYLLVRDSVTQEKLLDVIKDVLRKIISHTGEVFGCSPVECGNYKTLNLENAKKVSETYLDIIKDTKNIITYNEVK